MPLYFRPFWGLTVFTLIGVVILSSLGMWQYQRLQWKTTLLSDVEAAADAAPFDSLAAVQRALSEGKPVNFRRIGVAEAFIHSDAGPLWVYQSRTGGIFWRGFFPVSQSPKSGEPTVYGAFMTVEDAQKTDFRQSDIPEIRDLVGYVRLPKQPGWLTPKATPDKNRYFLFNQTPEWRRMFVGESVDPLDLRFYLDIQSRFDVQDASAIESTVDSAVDKAAKLPPLRPDIPNNHFDYMLTWFGLALTLCVFYFILHYRAGRLRWGHAV